MMLFSAGKSSGLVPNKQGSRKDNRWEHPSGFVSDTAWSRLKLSQTALLRKRLFNLPFWSQNSEVLIEITIRFWTQTEPLYTSWYSASKSLNFKASFWGNAFLPVGDFIASNWHILQENVLQFFAIASGLKAISTTSKLWWALLSAFLVHFANHTQPVTWISFHVSASRLLPFGAGKRVCPGEVLAKNRLFLFVASFMQNFTFVSVEGEERPVYDPRAGLHGLVTQTPPFRVRALIRREWVTKHVPTVTIAKASGFNSDICEQMFKLLIEFKFFEIGKMNAWFCRRMFIRIFPLVIVWII